MSGASAAGSQTGEPRGRRATGQESHGAGKPRGRWRHQHHCPHSPSTEPPSPSDLGPARTLESPSLLLPEVTLLCPTGFYSVCARPGLKNTGNPLTYGVLSPQSSVLSDTLPLPPRSQPLSPWISDTTVTCLGSPPTPRSGCSGGSPALFLFSQGPGEHSAHGPVSENSCFMQSAQSSSCFSWEESWNPGTPSGPGAEVPAPPSSSPASVPPSARGAGLVPPVHTARRPLSLSPSPSRRRAHQVGEGMEGDSWKAPSQRGTRPTIMHGRRDKPQKYPP